MITDLVTVLAIESALRAVKAPKAPIWVTCMQNTTTGRSVYFDKYPNINANIFSIPPYTNIYYSDTAVIKSSGPMGETVPNHALKNVQISYF